jgi:hypothetical protein
MRAGAESNAMGGEGAHPHGCPLPTRGLCWDRVRVVEGLGLKGSSRLVGKGPPCADQVDHEGMLGRISLSL